jgi:uncharacterized Tic20 family protein
MTEGTTAPAYGDTVPTSPSRSERREATIAHVAGGVLAVVGLSVNFIVALAVLPALVLLLTTGRAGRSDWTQAREALNFQITWVGVTLIAQLIAIAIAVPLASRQPVAALDYFQGFYLVTVCIALFDLIVSVRAAVRVRRDEPARYPLSFRLVK